MKRLKQILLLSLATSLLVAAPTKKAQVELQSVKKVGQRGATMLLQTLGKNMKKRMKDGGAMKALDFCSNEAYSLTERVNKKLPNGVRVKRISEKFRSPANKPSEDEVAVLKTFEQMQKANIILPKHLIQKVAPHKYKYYKPLLINKKVCLKCHGDVKDIDLKRAIATRYPIDNAMGYKMGDFRGAVIVTIDKSKK